MPLYPIIPIIAILGGVYTLVSTLIAQTGLALGGIGLTVIGLLFYTENTQKIQKNSMILYTKRVQTIGLYSFSR